MAKSFTFEIVTPEKLFYIGDAEIVIVRTMSGDEGFMAGHSWAFKLLDAGELRFKEAGSKEFRIAAIAGGFIDVTENVLIFTDSAEWPEEIDIDRAAAAGKRETEWLSQHKQPDKDKEEIMEHKKAAKRAANRQKVVADRDRQRH